MAGCSTCGELRNSAFRSLIFKGELWEKTVGPHKLKRKDCRARELNRFLKAINALLNEGEGIVCIHGANPYLLGLFDEQVDDKMHEMVMEYSFYHENFERHFEAGQDHVFFRVKRKIRPPITLDLNSKVSLNRGVADPSHTQMRCFLRKISSAEEHSEDGATARITPTFVKDAEVMIQPGVFQESVGLEVKNISHGIPQQYQISDNRITNLAHYIWEGLRLPHYISAFSKLPSGGSVFFGLSEQKDRNLETGKEYTTGRIICEGLQLSNGERDRLRETFLEKVRNPELMLWVSRFEVQAPVKVAYHQVHGGEQDLCVIEVKIANVDGVSFYRDTSLYESSGPKAFKLHRLTESVDPQDPDSQLESTSVEQWVKDQLEYTNPLQQEIRDDQFPRRQAPVFPS